MAEVCLGCGWSFIPFRLTTLFTTVSVEQVKNGASLGFFLPSALRRPQPRFLSQIDFEFEPSKNADRSIQITLSHESLYGI